MCRAVGYVIGCLLIKVVQKLLKLHQLIIIALAFSGFFVLFSLASSMYFKGFLFFLGSIGNSWIDTTINICIIELFQTKNLNKWMQICHGAFGVGGLIGPIIVYKL